MTYKLDDIKAAYDRGQERGATHMIVAYDSFDRSNYPIYVAPGDNPLDCFPSNGDRVDEVYRYALGWDAQASEKRAYHPETEQESTAASWQQTASKIVKSMEAQKTEHVHGNSVGTPFGPACSTCGLLESAQ